MNAAPQPPAPIVPARRRVGLTVLLCAVIFVAGGVVGAGATILHLGSQARDGLLAEEDITPKRAANRLARKLRLDAVQTQRVEAVLERHQAALLAARAQAVTLATPQLSSLEREVSSVLRPEQVAEWRSHFRRLMDVWLPRRGPAPRAAAGPPPGDEVSTPEAPGQP